MADGPNRKNAKAQLLFFIFSILVICAFATGFLTPYFIRGSNSSILIFADNVGKTIADYAVRLSSQQPTNDNQESSNAGRVSNELSFRSILMDLKGEIVDIPKAERDGAGGGMTSFGEYVVLLTHEGKIYVIDESRNVTLTNIHTPDSGFEAYEALSKEPPYNAYRHELSTFRYNDILAFESNDRIALLISFTKYHAARECYTNTIARVDIDGTVFLTAPISSDQWVEIYESIPCLPLKTERKMLAGDGAGGRMAFDGQNTLYLANGDYNWDGYFGPPNVSPDSAPMAQDPAADYGKIISIDLETGQYARISSGHRNPQGIVRDKDGTLWAVEHGPRGGDELNEIISGRNYGWPLESYGTQYNRRRLPLAVSFGRHENFEKPVFAWLPSIAVSGLTQIEGFHEAWDGDLLAASLRGQMLVRIRIADHRAVVTESIPIARRIRYVHQHTNGEIVIWTDDSQIIFLNVEDR